MKKLFIFIGILLALQSNLYAREFIDTVREVTTDDEIDEVIKAKTVPQFEKVQHLSQVTKYGFKNLFSNYSYNPSIPYSSQVNPYAETYMQDYLQAHGKQLQNMRGPAIPYFNLIDNVLSQYGLPRELKYLAVIESNLKSNATSWVGAKGPWQFMSYTARDCGLLVNDFIDERTDYYKSTHAAARYLLSLYKDLKDWLLVIAAYNGGPGRVYSAIKKSGSRNFWALQYYLPEESRNHVKKFIATHYIMETGNDAGTINFDYSKLNPTYPTFGPKADLSEADLSNTDVLKISGRYNSLILSKNLTFDINEFNRLNPSFDAALANGDDYQLRLPADKMDLFVANKYPILNECVQLLLTDPSMEVKTSYKKKK